MIVHLVDGRVKGFASVFPKTELPASLKTTRKNSQPPDELPTLIPKPPAFCAVMVAPCEPLRGYRGDFIPRADSRYANSVCTFFSNFSELCSLHLSDRIHESRFCSSGELAVGGLDKSLLDGGFPRSKSAASNATDDSSDLARLVIWAKNHIVARKVDKH